ncbi:MAG: alcohol dehydrogenase catalytic domain-containing protein [Phycisphaeraceae bacterium]
MKMLAAQYTQGAPEGQNFAVREVERPTIGPDELLLRVQACSICGTDLKIVGNGHRKLRDGQTITLGHEFVGTIEEVGSRLTGFAEGDRVGVAPNSGCGRCGMCMRGMGNMCATFTAFGIDGDGAHTEFVRIPAAAISQGNVIPLSDGMPWELATLAEPLSCVVNAQRGLNIETGETVLVYGAGPMGLLNVMLAAAAGATRLIVVDLKDERLAAAKKCGATQTINSSKTPVKEVLAEGEVDVVVTAVPVPQLQQEAMALLGPFGRLCLFAGWAKGTNGVPLDTNPIHYKNLIVTGATGGSARDYATALRLISSGKVDVSKIISDVFTLEELDEAYAAAMSGEVMKVVMVAEKTAAMRAFSQNGKAVAEGSTR